MRVLWFSSLSFNQKKDDKYFYPGGNWIISLKELLEIDQNIELGIAFWGKEELVFEDNAGTKYYQITKKHTSKINRYYKNWCHEIGSDHQIESLTNTIRDFNPDIIQIFGTESVFGNIVKYTKIPLVIHLQGIINPCLNAWRFPGYKITSLIKSLNWIYFLKGFGLYHDYFLFKKMAKRELEIYSLCTNYMGRTHWDKAITKLYSPHARYYHCAEVIRDGFYLVKWELPQSGKLILSSIINANIYKGLDLILKTAICLKKNIAISFEWRIYGIKSDSEYAQFVEDIVGAHFSNNNIVLKGVTLSDDLLKGLLESKLFVHSSYIDNSPNSVCEAQLIGLPVISTNVGGISSLIQDEVDGFLVPANEPHILASKIIELANNPDKLLTISKNSIEVAHKRHDRSNIKENLIDIYTDIVSKNKLPIINN